MGELSAIIGLIRGAPTETAVALSALVVLVTIWLNSRKVDMEAITSINKTQMESMKALMEQNSSLAADLDKLRKSQAESLELIGDMRKHIFKLEEALMRYQTQCNNCPLGIKPAAAPAVPTWRESQIDDWK